MAVTWLTFFAVIAVIGFVFLGMFLIFLKSVSSNSREDYVETDRMIQEMYQELKTMRNRVETLETVLLDKYHKGE